MRKLPVRVAVTLILLGGCALLSAFALYPTRMQRGSVKAGLLPLQLGDWVGREVPIDDKVKQILETDDVVQRVYASPLWQNVPVHLAVVFSPDNRRVAHPPEICYRGEGWEVTAKSTIHAQGLPELRRVVLGTAGHRDLVLYCFKAGEDITANYYRQQINIIVNQLRLKATSSALIRFSTAIRDTESLEDASGAPWHWPKRCSPRFAGR